MKRTRTLAAAVILLAALVPHAVRAETVEGVARVIDGDTIEIAETRIRLHGIDAPELAQRCTEDGTSAAGGGALYPCGLDASQALRKRIGRKPVSCIRRDTDKYGRMVGLCTVEGIDVSRWMVQQGQAIAFRRYSLDYVADEDAARLGKVGLWAGEFQDPSEFRRQARGEPAERGNGVRPARVERMRRPRVCNCPEDLDRIGHRCGRRAAASSCTVAAR